MSESPRPEKLVGAEKPAPLAARLPDRPRLIEEAGGLLRRLFPICRSLTGEGVRSSLRVLQEVAGFELHEVPSGTACYDWTVPDEWNIHEAYIADLSGERLVDFRTSNLHVVGYSEPVDAEMSFDELAPHLHSLPAMPRAIPYRTAYYARTWGFCLSHEQLERMDRTARYRVRIDSTLAPGRLTYGERILAGTSGVEFLISTYCCHPSLANDNLSGMVLWALLLRALESGPTRHSYRFVIAPETIGAIAYLSSHEQSMRAVEGGFVITTVAGPGPFGYKQSFRGDHWIDRAVRRTFAERRIDYLAYPFDISGSDERHFSSPFFRIPIGTLCKDKYYEYDYYHTSLDDLEFVSPEALVDSLGLYLAAIETLELDERYRSRHPYSEPMLGKRGLYPSVGGAIRQKAAVEPSGVDPTRELDAIRWLMFWGDGATSLLEVAERTGLPMRLLYETAGKLVRHGLLERVPGSPGAGA